MYSRMIPVPVCLTLMLTRANEGYYRQPAALLGDARSIFVNCSLYNEDGSAPSLAAAALYRELLRGLSVAFPSAELGDYCVFERCLGERVAVRSLLRQKTSGYLYGCNAATLSSTPGGSNFLASASHTPLAWLQLKQK